MKYVLAAACLCLTRTLLSASFEALPVDNFLPYGISDDGRVAVGEASQTAFRWSVDDGIDDLGFVNVRGYEGVHYTEATGVSGDGIWVVGTSTFQDFFRSIPQAFVWTPERGIRPLGGRNYWESRAEAISSKGNVVVGYVILKKAFTQHAAIWSRTGRIRRLQAGTSASGVSPNGLWVVGTYAVGNSSTAFRWSKVSGFESLGSLPANGNLSNVAKGVSNDGSVIVGQGGDDTPFLWTVARGMESLGVLEDGDSGYAEAVSADGKLVVGAFSSAGAFCWSESDGLRSLHEFLATDFGLDLTGWSLRGATAISSDGTRITGYGFFNGNPRGWIASLD